MPYEFLLDEDQSACGTLISVIRGAGDGNGVVLFVGAGVSAPLEYPTWPALVDSLVESAHLTGEYSVNYLRRPGIPLPAIAEHCWRSLRAAGRETSLAWLPAQWTWTALRWPNALSW